MEARQRVHFDEYTDEFIVTTTPFGVSLSFRVRATHPTPFQHAESQHLGTVRMSVEHLKVLVMLLWKQVRQAEAQHGFQVQVSRAALNQMQIAPEDWEAFWGIGGG